MGTESDAFVQCLSNLRGAFPDIALLVGAGFSKNFGGFLASDVWERLLGTEEIVKDRTLRQMLLAKLNFEDALEMARGDNSADSGAMEGAIRKVYQDQERCFPSSGDNITVPLVKLINELKPNGTRVVFSLNQDLLFERWLSKMGLTDYACPWVANELQSFDEYWECPVDHLAAKRTKHISSEPSFDPSQVGGRASLIKLHGSWNWQSDGGQSMMVVGGGKEEAIMRFRLLDAYVEVFREWCRGKRVLLIVGYGFMDSHINNIIREGVAEGLRLYIIDPRSPRDLYDYLTKHDLRALWANGVGGYCTQPLKELLHIGKASGGLTPVGRRVRTELQALLGVIRNAG